MRMPTERWKRVLAGAAVALVLLVLVRETGLVSLNLNSSASRLTTTRLNAAAGKRWPTVGADEVRPGISFADYVPFYKQRQVVGTVTRRLGEQTLTFEYDLTLTVRGVCSGHDFRKQITELLLAAANK
jgi:hypothetical protein